MPHSCFAAFLINALFAALLSGLTFSCRSNREPIKARPITQVVGVFTPVPKVTSKQDAGKSLSVCEVGMVYIKGGAAGKEFVSSFCMNRTEVLVSEYRTCVQHGGCVEPAAVDAASELEFGRCNWSLPDTKNHPVNCVSHADAERYCNWRGWRLPTSREWWWVASGREERRAYPWGDQPPGVDDACWSPRRGGGRVVRKRTCPDGVHARDTSLDGVVDLAGNVSEWTATQSSRMTYVVRGGSFNSAHAAQLDVATGSEEPANDRYPGRGFRCVSNLQREK